MDAIKCIIVYTPAIDGWGRENPRYPCSEVSIWRGNKRVFMRVVDFIPRHLPLPDWIQRELDALAELFNDTTRPTIIRY